MVQPPWRTVWPLLKMLSVAHRTLQLWQAGLGYPRHIGFGSPTRDRTPSPVFKANCGFFTTGPSGKSPVLIYFYVTIIIYYAFFLKNVIQYIQSIISTHSHIEESPPKMYINGKIIFMSCDQKILYIKHLNTCIVDPK